MPRSSRAPAKKVVKRSSTGLAVKLAVAGILVIVCGVAAIELLAWFGHSKTVAAIQQKMALQPQDRNLTKATVAPLVSGFPSRFEHSVGDDRRITLRWRGAINRYVLQLKLDADENVVAYQVQDVQDDASRNVANAGTGVTTETFNGTLPERGFANATTSLLGVVPSEVDMTYRQSERQEINLQGLLIREIVRQAFLLSARDELGLDTRDFVLGENQELTTQGAASFPLELSIRPTKEQTFRIQVVSHVRDKPSKRLVLLAEKVADDQVYPAILEAMELQSRGGIPDVLKQTGHHASDRKKAGNAPLDEEVKSLISEIDLFSQLAAARILHQKIRAEGESFERLAALSRVYANLGSLTESHWLPHPHAFKARALLYAQRLVAQTNGSAEALAHRAYAWALAGRLKPALDELDRLDTQIKSGKLTGTVPGWAGVLRAYSAGRGADLDNVTGPDDSLARYLRVLLADPLHDKPDAVFAAERLLERSPACLRAFDCARRAADTDASLKMVDEALEKGWPKIYETLLKIPGLPPRCQEIARARAGGGKVNESEADDRAELCELLTSTADDTPALRLAIVGRMLQEVSFVEQQSGAAGLNPTAIESLRRLFKGHPYSTLFEIQSSSPDKTAGLMAKLRREMVDSEITMMAFPVCQVFGFQDPGYFEACVRYGRMHVDETYSELKTAAEVFNSHSGNAHDFALGLRNIAPDLSTTAMWSLVSHFKGGGRYLEECEEKFQQSFGVQSAVGDRYYAARRFEDAERCLRRVVGMRPTAPALNRLADCYYELRKIKPGMVAKQRETLRQVLQLPDSGYNHSQARQQLAQYHIDRFEFDQGLPLAQEAALIPIIPTPRNATVRTAALRSAAECLEGVGQYAESESHIRDLSENYNQDACEWYFWCLRTGKGDLKAAQELASTSTMQLEQTHRPLSLAIYWLVADEPEKAELYFTRGYQMTNDNYLGMHAALCALARGGQAEFVDTIRRVSAEGQQFPYLSRVGELMMRHVNGNNPWDDAAFEFELSGNEPGEATNLYYFAGRFLQLRGDAERSTRYLKLAASSPAFRRYTATLAAHQLKSLKIDLPARRETELGDSLAPLEPGLREVYEAYDVDNMEQMLAKTTALLENHPENVTLLSLRAYAADETGHSKMALEDLNLAIKLAPNVSAIHSQLATILATIGDDSLRKPDEAFEQGRIAYDLSPVKHYHHHAALAAACAAQGDFARAADYQRQALMGLPGKKRVEAEGRLKMYENKQTYRRPLAP